MEYQYIVNPETNRRVSLDGRLGRRILRNYLAQWQRGGDDTKTYYLAGSDCEIEGQPIAGGAKIKVISWKGECPGDLNLQKDQELNRTNIDTGGGAVKLEPIGVTLNADSVTFTEM